MELLTLEELKQLKENTSKILHDTNVEICNKLFILNFDQLSNEINKIKKSLKCIDVICYVTNNIPFLQVTFVEKHLTVIFEYENGWICTVIDENKTIISESQIINKFCDGVLNVLK